jgi:uncharacterized protein YbjT (DUF2867 family)
MIPMSPKRIVVFGGTGITGVFFCKKALERGHQLTIYARNPSKLPDEVTSNASAKVRRGFVRLYHVF